MKKFKSGSDAHRTHMSKVMKASWVKRRAGKAWLEKRTQAWRRPISVKEPIRNEMLSERVVSFNYCPNCGTHLARLYS